MVVAALRSGRATVLCKRADGKQNESSGRPPTGRLEAPLAQSPHDHLKTRKGPSASFSPQPADLSSRPANMISSSFAEESLESDDIHWPAEMEPVMGQLICAASSLGSLALNGPEIWETPSAFDDRDDERGDTDEHENGASGRSGEVSPWTARRSQPEVGLVAQLKKAATDK